MARLFRALVLAFPLALCGCGGGDPNKDLKPVDPNTPKPGPNEAVRMKIPRMP